VQTDRQSRYALSGWAILLVLFDTITLGFVTLGFEMVTSRILTPLFGSGIYTWATIISIVVAGLMCGYFVGGLFADRYPSFGLASAIKLISGIYFLFVYFIAGERLEAVLALVDGEILPLFLAAFVVCFPPLLVLGMFSPLGVRLILADPRDAGFVSGGLFAISCAGNIAGILMTTFLFIPNFGSRAITLAFATFLLASGILSYFVYLSQRPAAKLPSRA
jgi:hypothetical protein